MFYNVYQRTPIKAIEAILALEEKHLVKAVNAYLEGKYQVTINGKKHRICSDEFAVYRIKQELGSHKETVEKELLKHLNFFYRGTYKREFFKDTGVDVTEEFLQDREFGSEAVKEGPAALLSHQFPEYVNLTRLSQLKAIQPSSFDLKRLIRLCEELNSANANESWHSVALLVRAVIDHVPPIFGSQGFAQVASSGTQSFNASMTHLQTSMRKIADAHLHTQIRASEVLPNRTQVDCARELDVLLAEIVRRLQ